MSAVTFELRGMDEYREKVTDPALLAEGVTLVLDEASVLGKDTAERGVDGGTGVAIRSIFRRVQPDLMRVGTTMPDARALSIEQGRPVGDAPHPVAAERWLQGSTRVREPSEEAFRIAAAIRERGVRGRFFMEAARQRVQEALPALVRDAGRRIQQLWQR